MSDATGVGETSSPKTEDVFALGQDTAVESPFEYDENALNLVTEFKKHPEGKASLRRIGKKCLDDFENAWRATDKFRSNMADTWKLFSGTLDKKPPPFENMANAHVPILMENTIRMVFRQAYELFGNWTNVFGVNPIGPDDEKTAKLLSLHGNWQIRKRIKDFKRQIGHRGLLIFDLFGDVTCHSFWDPQRRCNRHEILTANEFVCANAHVSTMPDYSDVSWLAKLIYMDGHELRKREGQWEDIGNTLKMMPPDWDDPLLTRELRDAIDKSMGVDSTEYQRGQYRVVQYEGWLNLPNQKRDRYVQVFVDYQTGNVLSMGIHERQDSYDKRRYEMQQKQLQEWQANQQEIQAFNQEKQQAQNAALDMGHAADPTGDGASQAVLMARQIDEMPAPPSLPMPEWMNNDPTAVPREPDFVPIRLFAHGVNIEPIQGILGMGTGQIHAAQNKAANILTSMYIDQGTLANFQNFLAREELRLPEKFSLAPGKIHKVAGAGIDLGKDIVPLAFGKANDQLVTLIQLIQQWAQSVSNTPEVLSGEAGKSGETAQGLANRIEQATKMLSVPTQKYADFLTVVLENNALLNAIFMDDVEFFSVNNHDPELGAMGRQNMKIGREMYDRPYDVEISADLKFTSTSQRISESDALIQLPNAVPAMQQNFAFIYEAIKKSLEARNRYDMIAMMGPPPAPPVAFGAPTSPPAPPPGAVSPGPPGAQGQPPTGGQPQQQKPPAQPKQPEQEQAKP